MKIRVFQVGGMNVLGEPAARGGDVPSTKELIGPPLVGGHGRGFLGYDHDPGAGGLQLPAMAGEHRDVRVDQREDQMNSLSTADLDQRRDIGGLRQGWDDVRAIGLLQGRRQGIHVHGDDVPPKPQLGVSSPERPKQLDPAADAGEKHMDRFNRLAAPHGLSPQRPQTWASSRAPARSPLPASAPSTPSGAGS
jgi:hypothetical protein